MKYVILLLFILEFIPNNLDAQTLSIYFVNIKNEKGVFRLGFYIDGKSFLKGDPLFERTVSKSKVKNGILTVAFNELKVGTYGIAVLDDENNNNKIDVRI